MIGRVGDDRPFAVGPRALAAWFLDGAGGEPGAPAGFVGQHLQLHAAFGAGLLVAACRWSTSSQPADQVGGQADFDDRRGAHAEARGVDRRAVRDACRTARGRGPNS